VTLAVGPTAAALRHIEAVVAERQLGPGDKLPTERELAAEAGVSRAVVRSVLEDLENRGTVVRYVGRGTFLAPSESAAAETANHPSPSEIMSSRLILEP
jgi:DNA-binding FadR family transcriptional regulator